MPPALVTGLRLRSLRGQVCAVARERVAFALSRVSRAPRARIDRAVR